MLELTKQAAASRRNDAAGGFVAAMATVAQHSADLFVLVDRDGALLYANPAAIATFGVTLEDALGTNAISYLHPDDATRVTTRFIDLLSLPGSTMTDTVRFVSTSDEVRILEIVSTNRLHDPDVRGILVNGRDITERRQLETDLLEQSLHDPLSGLANRTLFVDRAERILALATRDGVPVSVLYVDLDNFKTFNDGMGHRGGDQLLVAVAQRMALSLRQDDLLCRLGGDEFAVLVHPRSAEGSAELLAERLGEVLRAPFQIDGRTISVSASIGIAAGADQSIDDLLRDADIAMFEAKSKGKGQAVTFMPQMVDSANDRLQLLLDLQHALEHHEFVVHYQPVIDLETTEMTGVEALVRWEHPTRGQLSPADFIPCAEESGMIVDVGRLVLEDACRQAVAWGLPGLGLTLAVNLSARQLSSLSLLEDVAAILASTGMSPGSLVLEVTETTVMHDVEAAIERLRSLKDLGVRLAIDDFGTGYSSLSYLRKMPIDILKIDRSFVSDLHDSSASKAIVHSLIELGTTLDLELIAEGVELEAQQAALLAQHCTLAQGFLFARPMRAEDLSTRLDDAAPAHPHFPAIDD
jgi:diguanylate cyclase (GGDEF)-like protein/PAS domain S-box-containing protein